MANEAAELKHVRIERRGGFAGIPASAETSVAALTPAQRRALDVALALKPGENPSPPGPDRFSYRIHTTDSQGAVAVVDIAEDAMPAALVALCKSKLP